MRASTIAPAAGQHNSPLLQLEDISASYGDFQALSNLTLHVNAGEVVSLIGANGAGKTTILRVISGLLRPQDGKVRFAGQDIARVPAHEIVERGISHVPEGRQLFPYMSVEENLILGAYITRARPHWKHMMEEQFELFPHLAKRRRQRAGTLSGGEQQMVAIARALMSEPAILLLDEPSLGLAPIVVKEVFDKIQAISHKGMTVMIVEQNIVSSLDISDRGYVIENGEVRLEGTSSNLLNNKDILSAYFGDSISGHRESDSHLA